MNKAKTSVGAVRFTAEAIAILLGFHFVAVLFGMMLLQGW